MTMFRRLPLLALAAMLLLPGAATAQDDTAEPSATPAAVDDTRIAELRALVPEQLAGIPLREDLQVATGEQLAGQMSDDEYAVFEEMLTEQGRSFADYVAASVYLPITDTQVVVVKAHRVEDIDASETIDGWIEMNPGRLLFSVPSPYSTHDPIDGRIRLIEPVCRNKVDGPCATPSVSMPFNRQRSSTCWAM